METSVLEAAGLVEALGRNVWILKAQTEGLSDADSRRAPPFPGNCLNWVLGHIAVSRDDMLTALGAPPAFGARGARYRRGSEPLAEADPEALPLTELLAVIEDSQTLLAAALSQIDAAGLARPVRAGSREITAAQRVFFLYFHETYHVGQTELFRQAAGKTNRVI